MLSTASAATAIETFARRTISRSRVVPRPDCVPKIVFLLVDRAREPVGSGCASLAGVSASTPGRVGVVTLRVRGDQAPSRAGLRFDRSRVRTAPRRAAGRTMRSGRVAPGTPPFVSGESSVAPQCLQREFQCLGPRTWSTPPTRPTPDAAASSPRPGTPRSAGRTSCRRPPPTGRPRSPLRPSSPGCCRPRPWLPLAGWSEGREAATPRRPCSRARNRGRQRHGRHVLRGVAKPDLDAGAGAVMAPSTTPCSRAAGASPQGMSCGRAPRSSKERSSTPL